MKWQPLSLALLPLLLAGCAKFPATPDAQATRIVFTLEVDGKIRTGREDGSFGLPYVYMVAINTSTQDNPTTTGPVPVIAPPWGNGFVAGDATYFVWWDPTQATEFTLYQFKDQLLTQWIPVGAPIAFTQTVQGTKQLRFELSINQLAATPADAANLKSLQINFLTMDRIPQSGTDKFWDALGDGTIATSINSPVTIPLRTSGIYDNQRANNLEPRGDQAIPDLDIVDWSVEVRLPQQ